MSDDVKCKCACCGSDLLISFYRSTRPDRDGIDQFEKAEHQIRQKDSRISFLLGEIKEALDCLPENCSAARLLTDAMFDEANDE